MNKFFLTVRIIVLVALLILLAAVFWGVANRESTHADDNVAEAYEEYQRSMPAGYTSILLIALVEVGVFVALASVFFADHQLRKGTPRMAARIPREENQKTDWQ